jgi:hypothetical protein
MSSTKTTNPRTLRRKSVRQERATGTDDIKAVSDMGDVVAMIRVA